MELRWVGSSAELGPARGRWRSREVVRARTPLSHICTNVGQRRDSRKWHGDQGEREAFNNVLKETEMKMDRNVGEAIALGSGWGS